MTLSDLKPIIDGMTAVLSLAAAIAGVAAAKKSSSAQAATEHLSATVNFMRNDLAILTTQTQTQMLQIANSARVENNFNWTFAATDVLQRQQPLDAQQMVQGQAPPPGPETRQEEKQ